MKQLSHLMSKSCSRRDFVRFGTMAATAVAIPVNVTRGMQSVNITPGDRAIIDSHSQLVNTEVMNALVLRAIDAARSAGARYADARVTRRVEQESKQNRYTDQEQLYVGVRALVDGAWGFATSPFWNMDEMAILAKEAVSQARINAAAFPRHVDLGTYPVVKGSWVTPIVTDPFKISPEEKLDLQSSWMGLAPRAILDRAGGSSARWTCERVERAVATSEGSLFSQTTYATEGEFKLSWSALKPGTPFTDASVSVDAKGLLRAGQGWERMIEAKVEDQVPKLIEEAEEYLYLKSKPVDVGRYEMVVSASVMPSLIAGTFADATQLDRALGHEANAGGTSYLGPDPMTYLGTTIATPLFSISGDRSLPKGLATVKWDDEGVVPETFPIVKDGVFVDYQTTREQAPWLAEWYAKQQRPVRSHGCSSAASAKDMPIQNTPNLQMQPGTADVSFDDMVRNTKKGIAFVSGRAGTDFQSRTGEGAGVMREIVDGKLGEVLGGAQILFDATQLWKTLLEIGGKDSVEISSALGGKGQPNQLNEFSIAAVPARFKDMTVIDGRRKS